MNHKKPENQQMISRLREERKNMILEGYEIGYMYGSDWPISAGYSEIQYALSWETTNKAMRNKDLISYDPRQDEILGDYFADVMECSEGMMGFEKTSSDNEIPDECFRAWEDGWKEGVVHCWSEIKDEVCA